ncbi:LysE family translocator [Geomonas oryzae]|uniref:LysE family translocator n=1 Tax=Geomonas oryzae TaxID=2364273 RepID=UPI00100A49BF|nr:LysE family transporter [Geomonas oryzae]
MFSILLTIWLLYLAVLLSPGANTLLITQLAASEQGKSARVAAMGVAVGSTTWCICAVCGLHVIFVVFPALRMALQISGATYLLYIAWRLWRLADAHDAQEKGRTVKSPMAAFRLGFLTNITNPKAALFFGSILAASFPPAPGWALQVAVIALVMVTSASWHLLLAYVFSRRTVRSGYARFRSPFNRLASLVVSSVGLGLFVATLKEAQHRIFTASANAVW